VLITAEGLAHHFEFVPCSRNYNSLLGYAILLGRRLLTPVPRSGQDADGLGLKTTCSEAVPPSPARPSRPGHPWGFEARKAEVRLPSHGSVGATCLSPANAIRR
jgi:hypothetical protein